MYEKYSFDELVQNMLNYVIENSGVVDTREGSIIYDAIAPAAFEMMNMFMEMNGIMNDTFADTASREYLIRRCAERGIIPEPATKAILKGEFNIPVPIGSRFSLEDLNYIVTEKINDTSYKMQCETPGIIGNSYVGTLIPIQYINGLETAKLTELLIPGEDEEDTEVLRNRYFQTFETKPFGGNKKDYIQNTNAIAGVGATKVNPVWNGGGTVLITIIDSKYDKASNTLIQTVKDILDPMPYGSGSGVAPIGHVVTVRTVDEIIIKITTSITFDPSYTFERVRETVEGLMKDYLLSLRKTWASSNELIVRISQIETKLLSVEGVIDVSSTKINGKAENLNLNENQIPIFGSITNG